MKSSQKELEVRIGKRELERLRDATDKFFRKEKQISVLVVAGGDSAEREVSLLSGKSVVSALKDECINCQLLNLDYEKLDFEFIRGFDVLFLTLHGGKGEDGTFQGFLDSLGICYVGANVLASAIGMNKPMFKMLVSALGLKTPSFVHIIGKKAEIPQLKTIEQLSTETVVIKPANQGSSVGVSIVLKEEADETVRKTVEKYGEVIVEEYIEGTEVTAAVLGRRTRPVVLPIVEIEPKKQPFYTYTAKYTEGETDYIVPARVDEAVAQSFASTAELIYKVVDFSPYVRIDAKVDRDNEVYLLEANTLPGFTSLSLFPMAAKAVGIDYPELLKILIYLAVVEYER